jgi:hypothetical protein
VNPLRNDAKLNKICMDMRKAVSKFSEYQREGKTKELWEAFETCQYRSLAGFMRIAVLRMKKK